MTSDNAFAKTICSICYEDLKPIVEDLQSISLCGHVFHELCLQQWFEYCSNSKKCNCPVCKQSCSAKNAGRLYFQSLGEPNDSLVSQKVNDREEDPEVLRGQVKRLEAKLSGVSSALEREEKEKKEVDEELRLCKEQVKKEVAQKNETLKEKVLIQGLLHSKSEQIVHLSSECSRLQERTIALAKELASLKLVSDLNLEEEEVLKLASLGNDGNKKDTVDTLIRSLVIRNKTYKELMSKCNLLGRGEARASENLEKAKTKIDKLKKRVKELETAAEAKDNEGLRALKASKKARAKGTENCANNNHNSSHGNNIASEEKHDQSSVPVSSLNRTSMPTKDPSSSKKGEDFISINDMAANQRNVSNIISLDDETVILIDDDIPKNCMTANELLNANSKHHFSDTAETLVPPISDMNGEANVEGPAKMDENLGSITGITMNECSTPAYSLEKDAMFNITRESPSTVPLCKPGDICFSGGLLGPDGNSRYLGKWCKRGLSNGSVDTQGSLRNSSDLISVGADGRGGKVKVLRSQSQPSSNVIGNFGSAKRLKTDSRPRGSQSQGCLQIEHFFGRASH